MKKTGSATQSGQKKAVKEEPLKLVTEFTTKPNISLGKRSAS